jgi:serine/threonine-protein kinase RsbW
VARRSVLEAFDAAGLTTERALDAALIASELIGNAVRHASPLPAGQLVLRWSVNSDGYQISVTDGGVPGTPRPAISTRHAGSHDAHGRGLRIVAELCDDWGVAARAGATTVWARTSTVA